MTTTRPLARFDPSPNEAAGVLREDFRVDVSSAVPFEGPFELAVSVVVAERPDGARLSMDSPVLLSCLPGGFLSRHYYDLEDGLTGESALNGSPESSRTFSFAEAFARRGAVIVAIDPFGVGDSDRPESADDAYSLSVERLAAIHQCGLEAALARLAQDDANSAIPRILTPRVFGVGHSMGSALTVEQQALAKPYAGLILFSFTTAGVPRFLTDLQREVANDPVRARAEIGRLTKASFGTPYPARATDSEEGRVAAFGVGTAPPAAEEALHRAATSLLGAAGLLSMIPDGYTPAAERVEVPVLIALGDHDLHGDEGLAAMLPRSKKVSTFTLDDCWHCHFVANTRDQLWQRVADWIQTQTHQGANP